MNHWLENSIKNLIPLSLATDFKLALLEWFFTNAVIDNGEEESVECQLCENNDLRYQFEIKNTNNENVLWVGSSCILKFDEINIYNELGVEITNKNERKLFLEQMLRKKLKEMMLDSLRSLWKTDADKFKQRIVAYSRQLKRDGNLPPKRLAFLFNRMDVLGIIYNPCLYKVSLRTHEEQMEFLDMPTEDKMKIKKSLSKQQLDKFHIAYIQSGKSL